MTIHLLSFNNCEFFNCPNLGSLILCIKCQKVSWQSGESYLIRNCSLRIPLHSFVYTSLCNLHWVHYILQPGSLDSVSMTLLHQWNLNYKSVFLVLRIQNNDRNILSTGVCMPVYIYVVLLVFLFFYPNASGISSPSFRTNTNGRVLSM